MTDGYGYNNSIVSVGTSPTLIDSGGGWNGFYLVKNRGPEVVYLGGALNPEATVTADETSTGGYPLDPGESVQIPVFTAASRDLYGVTASGTAIVSFLTPSGG
jgi:hypothetical protein